MSEAEQTLDEAELEEGEGEEGAPEEGGKRRLPGKFLVLYIALPLLLLSGAGAAAWHLGYLGGGSAGGGGVAASEPAFFYNLPEMLVNLSRRDERAQYLKLQVALEMSDRDVVGALEPVLPRIMDTFQVYLRELRSDDLEGSAGVYRLKEELLRRVNLAIAPRHVDRVLFKEIIIQ